jgi:hypothetical protein
VTVIDLGTPEAHEPGSPPVPTWLRTLGLRRPLVALAAAVVCVAPLGAAAPVDRGPVIYRLDGVSGDGAGYVVGDVLVTVAFGPRQTVSAYALDGAGKLWAAQTAEPVSGAAPIGAVLVVHTAPETIPTVHEDLVATQAHLSAGTTTGYDMRTGAVRWSRAAGLVSALDGRAALLISGAGAERTLLAVEAADGAVLWRRPLPIDRQWLLAERAVTKGTTAPDGLVELAPDGTLTMVDIGTGQAVAAGRILPGGTISFSWEGLLGVRYGPPAADLPPDAPPAAGSPERTLTVYDLKAGLTPLWSTPLTPRSELSLCDREILCDWSTGERRDLRTGRDVTATVAKRSEAISQIQVGRLGVWIVVAPSEDTWLVYADSGTKRPGPGWLGRVDPDDPALHVTPLLRLPSRIDQCIISPVWLVCSDSAAARSVGEGVAYAIRRADLDASSPLR